MNSLKEIIGLRLRAARKAADFRSAKSFAEYVGIPNTTYSQHESGKRGISVEVLLQYCNALDLDPNWLIFGGERPYIVDNQKKNLLNLAAADHNLENIIQLSEISSGKDISRVNTNLYNYIFVSVLKVIPKINIEPEEIVAFCTDVYNSVIRTSANQDAMYKMIDLSISSLLRGSKKTLNTSLNI